MIRKLRILIPIAIVLILIAVVLVIPTPSNISVQIPYAVIDTEGNSQETGILTIQGREYHRILLDDSISLSLAMVNSSQPRPRLRFTKPITVEIDELEGFRQFRYQGMYAGKSESGILAADENFQNVIFSLEDGKYIVASADQDFDPIQVFQRFAVIVNEISLEDPGSICIDLDTGNHYRNNELKVYAADGTTPATVAEIFESYGVGIDNSMSDVGIYRVVFPKAMSYKDLIALSEQIVADGWIEEAIPVLVSEFGTSGRES